MDRSLRDANASPIPVRRFATLLLRLRDERDEAKAQLEKARQALARNRWNIEEDGDDLLICDGMHEKSEGCQYVRYFRVAARALK